MKKEIHILDYLGAIWKRRISCIGIVFFITFGAIGYSFLMEDVYSAEATIIPVVSKSGSGGGMMGSLAAAVPFFGGASATYANQLMLFLKSRTLRERVVEALDLVPPSVPDSKGKTMSQEQALAEAANRLQGAVYVGNDRIYLDKITIRVEHNNPEMATTIARQYLVELQNFISNNALTAAKRYRLYLDEEIARNKKESMEFAKSLINLSRQRVSPKEVKIDVPLGMEVKGRLESLRNYEELKNKFDVLQKQTDSKSNEKGKHFVREVPQGIYLKYLQNQQFIMEQNSIMLEQAYQTAKLDEAKQEPSFQILETPIVPLHRIRPQRRVIARSALAVSVVVAILYVLWSEFRSDFRRMIFKESAQKEQKVAEVSDYRLGTGTI